MATWLRHLANLLGAVALGLTAIAATAAPTVPLSEYGKLPEVEDSAISPSGNRIAFVTTINGTRSILALENQTKAIARIDINDLKLRSIRWIGEDKLLMISSQTKDLGAGFTTDKAELFVGRIMPIGSEAKGRTIFGNSSRYANVIIGNYGVRKIGGRHFGFFGGIEYERAQDFSGSTYIIEHTRPHLFRVDLESMKVKKMAEAAPQNNWADWLVDKGGEIAFSMRVSDETGRWTVRNAQNKLILEGVQERGAVNLVGLGYDGQSAIIFERTDDGSRWMEIGQNGGQPKDFLEDVNFESLFFDGSTGHLMGYTIGEDEEEQHVFADKTLQQKAEKVRQAFASFEASFLEWTTDFNNVLIRTSGNQDSGTHYAVDLTTNRANPIAYERPAIRAHMVGPISTFEYTASDGLKMDGILTLPPGVEAKNLPVVLLPHGGPASADYPVFNWWAQAFASRGYAVFQPNFRGSTNRDIEFLRAGYGEYGRKMQTDKSDGLKALAQAGIVDPDRACIVGASYGGYAALVGVTIQQGLYKCAVAVAPLSDLRDRYNYRYRASGREQTLKVGLLEQMGDPDLWDDYSPLQHADKADAPIMLIHGVDDTVVPYSHSSKMADKLKDFGKPYELVTLRGEDHWLSLSVTRQQMLENAVRWVEKYNPAD